MTKTEESFKRMLWDLDKEKVCRLNTSIEEYKALCSEFKSEEDEEIAQLIINLLQDVKDKINNPTSKNFKSVEPIALVYPKIETYGLNLI